MRLPSIDGAKFSGNEVKADDVVESFNRSAAKGGGVYVPMLSPIASVKKDDKTVTVKTTSAISPSSKRRLSIVRVVPANAPGRDRRNWQLVLVHGSLSPSLTTLLTLFLAKTTAQLLERYAPL